MDGRPPAAVVVTVTRACMWLLLVIVAAAAVVLSFAALRDLALLCGFTPGLAWLLPVVIDAGAAAGCLVWLGSGAAVDARTFGRALTGVLLASSVAGNAIVHGLHAYDLRPHWVLVVAVSAVAPAVLGAVVHLAVLVGRQPADVSEPVEQSHPVPVDVPMSQSFGHQLEPAPEPEPVEATPAPRRNPPTKTAGPSDAAQRQKASRDRKKRHDAGDHSTCLPGRCPHADTGRINGTPTQEAVMA